MVEVSWLGWGILWAGVGATVSGLILYRAVRIRRFRNLQVLLEREVEAALSDRLSSLRKLTMFVGANVDLQKILDHITETGLESFQCEQVSILLLDEQSGDLVVLSAAGLIRKDIVGSRQKVGYGVAGKVAETGQAIILGPVVDPRRFVGFESRNAEISASMVTPILLRNDLIGVLCVSSKKADRVYTETDLQVLQMFSEIVAVCIRHAQQADWMRQTISHLEERLADGTRRRRAA